MTIKRNQQTQHTVASPTTIEIATTSTETSTKTTYDEIYTNTIKPIEDEIYTKTIKPIEDEIQKVKSEINDVNLDIKSMQDERERLYWSIYCKMQEIKVIEAKKLRPLGWKLKTANSNKFTLLYSKFMTAVKNKPMHVLTERGAIDIFKVWWTMICKNHARGLAQHCGGDIHVLDISECISKEFKGLALSSDTRYSKDPPKLPYEAYFYPNKCEKINIPLKIKLAMQTLEIHIVKYSNGFRGYGPSSRIKL